MRWWKVFVVSGLMCVCQAHGDSLFNPEAAKDGTLVAERGNRFELGDIVTVLVKEQVDATTTADTNTKKEADVGAQAPAADNTFLLKDPKVKGGFSVLNEGDLPNWGVQSKNETKNRGQTKRNSTLTTSISCFVTEVFPNGNIRIEGDKQVSVNREDSLLKVCGVARSRDVTTGNTVQSTQLANVTVSLKGKGVLWNNDRRGFVTRILDWFSPF